MDKYISTLTRIASNTEAILGFNITAKDGLSVSQLPIDSILIYFDEELEKLSDEAAKVFNRNVGKKIASIAYVSCRLEFLGKKKIDFSGIPCGKIIAESLIPFTRRELINAQTIIGIDKCVHILGTVESAGAVPESNLAYRYLRLFVILASIGMFNHAAVIANLLLTQMIVGGSK